MVTRLAARARGGMIGASRDHLGGPPLQLSRPSRKQAALDSENTGNRHVTARQRLKEGIFGRLVLNAVGIAFSRLKPGFNSRRERQRFQ